MTCYLKTFLKQNPQTQNSINEVKIPFKRQSSLKQYILFKQIKGGIKVWVRADAINSYMRGFRVYVGQQGNNTEWD